MNRMNLIILMDRLEDLIQSAPMIPFSGKGLVDVEEVMGLLEKIRAAIPDEIRQAEAISGERDRFLEESRAQAERIILQAEEYAARLVADSEIVKKSQEEGRRIFQEARRKSRELEQNAQKYASDILANLQKALERTLQVVERGRREVDDSLAAQSTGSEAAPFESAPKAQSPPR